MNNYFISFIAIEEGRTIPGNIPIKSNRKIKDITDIKKIEEVIKESTEVENVVILNWKEF